MSWKGIVKVTFPSHLQTLMALFPKSKVLKGLVSRSAWCYSQVVEVIDSMGTFSPLFCVLYMSFTAQTDLLNFSKSVYTREILVKFYSPAFLTFTRPYVIIEFK